MLKIMFGPVKFLLGILVNSTKFLWKKKIWKIKAFFVFFFTGVLLFIGFYQFVNLLAAYPILFIYAGTILLGTATAEKSSHKNEIKEALNEYKKYNVEWPEDIPVEKFREKGKKENLGWYLGAKIDKTPIYLSAKQRNFHTLLIGTTGSGKTSGIFLPLIADDIKNKRPLIIIDAKGDKNITQKITKFVRDSGREKDFQPFILSEVNRSCTYNPLQRGNSTQLKDKIISAMDWPTNISSTDSVHYQNKCANALQILFKEHNEKKDKEPLTLSQVYNILQNPDINQYPKLTKFLRTNLKNISSLTTELSLLINSEFGSLFESPKGEIDFVECYKNNKIIYFSLNTQSYSKSAIKLGKMITEELNTLNGEILNSIDFEDRHPIGIFIDEFQLFGTELFMRILTTGRTSGFMFLISITCIEELDKIGGKAYRAQIIQDTHTKIVMKINDIESAKVLSDLSGVYKTIEKTYQTITDRIISRLHTITEKVADKKIIPPQIFLELKSFEAIYIYDADSCKIFLAPIFINVKNEPLPEIRHRKNPDKNPPPSKPTPKSVF